MIAIALHRALHRPPDPQLVAERLRINLLNLVGEGSAAPDYRSARHLPEIGGQVGRNAINKIVLFRIIVQIGEWQDNQREPGDGTGLGGRIFMQALTLMKDFGLNHLPGVPVPRQAADNCADRSQ